MVCCRNHQRHKQEISSVSGVFEASGALNFSSNNQTPCPVGTVLQCVRSREIPSNRLLERGEQHLAI